MDEKAAKRHEVKVVVGVLVGFIGVFLPGTFEWQTPGAFSPVTLLIAAALCGALAGRILAPLHEGFLAGLAAMAGGALAAIGAFALLRWWVAGRDSVRFFEFLLVIMLGAIPGGLLGELVYKRLRRRPEPVPMAVARSR
jgi:hypothetical protein